MDLLATMIPVMDPWLMEEESASDDGPVSKPAKSHRYHWQKRCLRCHRIFHPPAAAQLVCDRCVQPR